MCARVRACAANHTVDFDSAGAAVAAAVVEEEVVGELETSGSEEERERRV